MIIIIIIIIIINVIIIMLCARGSPTARGEGGGRFEHSHLTEVAPNCLVACYDTRSESSGIFYYHIPAGGY